MKKHSLVTPDNFISPPVHHSVQSQFNWTLFSYHSNCLPKHFYSKQGAYVTFKRPLT